MNKIVEHKKKIKQSKQNKANKQAMKMKNKMKE